MLNFFSLLPFQLTVKILKGKLHREAGYGTASPNYRLASPAAVDDWDSSVLALTAAPDAVITDLQWLRFVKKFVGRVWASREDLCVNHQVARLKVMLGFICDRESEMFPWEVATIEGNFMIRVPLLLAPSRMDCHDLLFSTH